MKKLIIIISAALVGLSACSYDDTGLVNRVENLENRVTALEKLCKEMNSNITALQTIVEALQNNDYVTGVTPVEENGVVVGYTITFVKSAPITIYHGKDGKDGANGSDGKDGVDGVDGKDGYTPVIGVEKDSDGIYYWTLDGEWLTDNEGNKIKAVGVDGKDGVDGEDGKDGADGEDGKDGADGEDGKDGQNGNDGANGKDGITPQLKIENDYWYISYDNGASWTQLGKATGEDGQDGANGSNGLDGEDGDSFFQGVDISDDEYVIFTLADGTQIKLPTWYAFEQLKKQCEEMNKNISAMQQILEALQNNDYVTSVQQIVENGKTIGYTIYFSKSGAVTIYHGEDGKDGVDGEDGKDGSDGQNGVDGKDGHSPVVGVRQDSDGIYYWTLDGEWLTDDNGNKIKAVGIDGKDGEDGKDGANGEDGKDGANGTNGIDGITPLLKIENEYWYISYDNGASWTQLGKATGEDGKDGQDGNDGANGADGKDGDAFFQGVDTSDKNYVILTLVDGTQIKIPTWYAFEELQKMCNQMNTNISSLQTIVAALQNNDYVTSVAPVMDGGKTIGYTINFSKSGAVTIYHGENGKDGANGANGLDGHSPQIGVKQHTDGIYYWTLDGEWLTDDKGNKIKAVGIDGANGSNGANGTNGIDGITPLLKIENEYWYISYDNGTSWTQLGKATGEDGKDGDDGKDGIDGTDGDAFFQSVTQDEQYVYFTLADGTKITLPKGALLDVVFDASDLVIMSPNTTREIGYTVTSVTESVTVEVVSSSDIKAKVVAADASGKSGNIVVTTSAVIDEYSKVVIFVSNGEKVVMKSIGFEQGGLKVSDNAEQSISPLGGEVVLKFATNMAWRVEIPASAKSWISVAATPMAMTEYSKKLNVSPNTTLSTRSATVKIVSEDGALSADFIISQGVFDSFTASGSWQRGENIAVFAGNNKNQKFSFNGTAFTPAAVAKGAVTATEAHYAVSPYASNATLGADGKIGLTFASEQTRTVGGVAKANDVKVAVTPNLETTHFEFRPACAYLCVRLWGDDQAIKYVALNSVGGEALSGAAIITPNVGGVPQCQMTGVASGIKLNCGSELNLGTSASAATELWIAVPAVTLAQGYTLTVAGFYGGEQTITFADAISFVAGETYTATSEVNISTNGPGVGVGGWGDGESVEGEI